VAEFRKNTGTNAFGRWELLQLKKVITLPRAMTKKGRQFFFEEKVGDTVSCRPG